MTWPTARICLACGHKVLLRTLLHTAGESLPQIVYSWDVSELRQRELQPGGFGQVRRPLSNMTYLAIGVILGTAIGSSVTLLLLLLLVIR